jgi:anti-anti-sigma regulatory factor
MSDSSDALLFNLSNPVSPESLQTLRASLVRSVAAGSRSLLVDLDDLVVLDAPVISALVSMQRAVREFGASIALRAGRTKILDTLRITALDKVFTIVVSEPAPAVAKRIAAPPRRARHVAALAVLGALSLLGGNRAMASAPQTPQELIASVIAQDADVASYRAHVSVDFKLRSFPYISQHLDGTTYYKRPDNFEVVFENVPSYAKGFDKLYSDIDDPSSWDRRFAMSLVGQRKIGGHDDVVIRLVQKVRGMIDHEDVAIDPDRAHIDSMEWYYYNGGVIAMTQTFERVGNVDVLAAQHATIRIPFVHAAADAAYTRYETGVPIDDAVFKRGSGQ